MGGEFPLREVERQQIDEGDASGKRVAEVSDRRELLGACQQVASGATAFSIYAQLQLRGELGNVLNLVEDQRFAVAIEERFGVLLRLLARERIIE